MDAATGHPGKSLINKHNTHRRFKCNGRPIPTSFTQLFITIPNQIPGKSEKSPAIPSYCTIQPFRSSKTTIRLHKIKL